MVLTPLAAATVAGLVLLWPPGRQEPAAVFAVLVTAAAGWRGLRSLAGLGLSFVVIGVFVLPSLLAGNSPLLVGLVGSSAIVFALLYVVHGFSARTTIALVGTLCGLLVIATLGAVMSRAAFLDGLTTDDRYPLDNLTGQQSLRAIFVCG